MDVGLIPNPIILGLFSVVVIKQPSQTEQEYEYTHALLPINPKCQRSLTLPKDYRRFFQFFYYLFFYFFEKVVFFVMLQGAGPQASLGTILWTSYIILAYKMGKMRSRCASTTSHFSSLYCGLFINFIFKIKIQMM